MPHVTYSPTDFVIMQQVRYTLSCVVNYPVVARIIETELPWFRETYPDTVVYVADDAGFNPTLMTDNNLLHALSYLGMPDTNVIRNFGGELNPHQTAAFELVKRVFGRVESFARALNRAVRAEVRRREDDDNEDAPPMPDSDHFAVWLARYTLFRNYGYSPRQLSHDLMLATGPFQAPTQRVPDALVAFLRRWETRDPTLMVMFLGTDLSYGQPDLFDPWSEGMHLISPDVSLRRFGYSNQALWPANEGHREILDLLSAPCHLCENAPTGTAAYPVYTFRESDYGGSVERPVCNTCREDVVQCSCCGCFVESEYDTQTYVNDEGNDREACRSCSDNFSYCDTHENHYSGDQCFHCADERDNDPNRSDPTFYRRSTHMPQRFFTSPREVAPPTPRPVPGVLYLGIELEMECHDSSDNREEVMREIQHPLWRFKHDGSLRDGIEAVTFPLTVEALRAERPAFESRFAYAREVGVVTEDVSTNDPSCAGLHVHLSRNALNKTALFKAMAFLHRNPIFARTIAGRRQGDLDQWASLSRDNVESLVRKASHPHTGDHRYSAVNTQNAHTVEFRLFKATLDPVLFFGRVLFPVALLTWCEVTPARHLRVHKFLAWLQNNRELYPEVAAMIEQIKPAASPVQPMWHGATLVSKASLSQYAANELGITTLEAAALVGTDDAERKQILRAIHPRKRKVPVEPEVATDHRENWWQDGHLPPTATTYTTFDDLYSPIVLRPRRGTNS